MNKPTHANLVDRASRWLRNSCRIPSGGFRRDGSVFYRTPRLLVVFTDMGSGCEERPDAIGFAGEGQLSVLIECKVSRGDFRDDVRKKRPRLLGRRGVGRYRFYMAPKGLLKPSEMPDDWGLLSVVGNRVTVERDATAQEHNWRGEMQMLFSGCRRLQNSERNAKRQRFASG